MSDLTLVCSTCDGKGEVDHRHDAPKDSIMSLEAWGFNMVPCPSCGGTGLVRERVERAVEAIDHLHSDGGFRADWTPEAVAAIRAYLAEEGDER